ncbi:MAG: acyl-CoA dehydrogenase [Halioglobus sp.]
MDFSLTEEQLLLRESVEKYVADHGGVERHRQLSRSELGFADEAWQTFAELGWLALPFAEADGGLGGTVTDLMVFSETLGKALVREPYLHSVVACGGLLSMAGSQEQRAAYIPELVEGNSQWAFAFAEDSSGYDFGAITTTVDAAGEGFTLTGSKIAVMNGHAADQLIVSALTEAGNTESLTLFIVAADTAGVSRRAFTAVDGSRGAVISFDAVQLSGQSMLGKAGSAATHIASAMDRAIVALGAESLGAMQVLLNATVEYCKTREQFGQAIGKFQALQHRMAEMYLKLEETRSLLYNAAILLEEGDIAAPAACAALKVKLGEAGRFISHEAVQLHGGIGMTDELVVGHLFKRLLLLAKLYGDDDYYLERYIQLQAA